jgi:hypothetical protein
MDLLNSVVNTVVVAIVGFALFWGGDSSRRSRAASIPSIDGSTGCNG